MWTILKVSLLNLLQYCFCFIICFGGVFWPWGTWDVSFRTRDGTHTACVGRWRPNHWTAPHTFLFLSCMFRPMPLYSLFPDSSSHSPFPKIFFYCAFWIFTPIINKLLHILFSSIIFPPSLLVLSWKSYFRDYSFDVRWLMTSHNPYIVGAGGSFAIFFFFPFPLYQTSTPLRWVKIPPPLFFLIQRFMVLVYIYKSL